MYDDPTFTFPDYTQNGGTAILTCDWGYNRNDLLVEMFRMHRTGQELLGAYKVFTATTRASTPKITRVSQSPRVSLLQVEVVTQNNLTIFLEKVLSQDHGTYWCSIQAAGTTPKHESNRTELNLSGK